MNTHYSLFKKYSLKSYYVPGIGLSSGNTQDIKETKIRALTGTYILGQEGGKSRHKQNK